MIEYLRRYAKRLDADIRTALRVDSVQYGGSGFTVQLAEGGRLDTSLVIAATGAFGRPYRPPLPGLDSFTGQLLHSVDYREPTRFAGQRVVIVGGANTAVQIAVELAHYARVTLATRTPVKFAPQRPLGRDMHFWYWISGFDHVPIGYLLRNPPHMPVSDNGRYRRAVQAGHPDQRRMFRALHGTELTWCDGAREQVDTLILATGYRPNLSYLASLAVVGSDGRPRHRRGLSTTYPGLAFVEWNGNAASRQPHYAGSDATPATLCATYAEISSSNPASAYPILMKIGRICHHFPASKRVTAKPRPGWTRGRLPR